MNIYVRDDLRDYQRRLSKRNYLLTEKLVINEFHDAVVLLPKKALSFASTGNLLGGVVSGKKFLAGFNRTNNQSNPGYWGISQGYNYSEADVETRNEEVLWGGVLIDAYGHFILEGLSRLWPFIDPQYSSKFANIKIVFSVFVNQKKWFYEFFKLLGLNLSNIEILDKNVKFKKIYVPDESMHSWFGYSEDYNDIYNKIIDSANKISPCTNFSKIYLSKSAYTSGPAEIINEKYFENFFFKHGYSVVALETLPIPAQISLLNNASSVVATEGSLSHVGLFCKPKTEFIILSRSSQSLLPQYLVNAMKKLDVTLVDVSLNFLDDFRAQGTKLLGITEQWKSFVKDFFNEEIEEDKDNTLNEYANEYIKKTVANLHPRVWRLKSFDILDRLFTIYDPNWTKIREQVYINNLTLSGSNKFIESLLGRETLFYRLHVSEVGWLSNLYESYDFNFNHNNRIEALVIHSSTNKQSIEYGALNKEGWTTSKLGGQVGSTGKHLPITGFYIKSTDPKYNVQYRALVFNNKSKSRVWTKWIPNGEKYTLTSEDEVFVNLQIKVLPPEFPASLPNANSQSSINKD